MSKFAIVWKSTRCPFCIGVIFSSWILALRLGVVFGIGLFPGGIIEVTHRDAAAQTGDSELRESIRRTEEIYMQQIASQLFWIKFALGTLVAAVVVVLVWLYPQVKATA